MASKETGWARRLGVILSPPPTPNRPPKQATGRAGRNLPWAIGTGVFLLVLVTLVLIAPPYVFVCFATLAICVGLWELAGAFARADIHLALPPLWVGTIGVLISAYRLGGEAMGVALGLMIVTVIVWRLLDGRGVVSLRDILASSLAAIYLPFQAGFAVMLATRGGGWACLVFIVVTIANDIGGYIAGVMWGKHPLAPKVSPSKSWEGFIGSLFACLATGIGGVALLGGPLYAGILVGIFTPILATLGDLGESLIKRDLGLKDMSNLIPGHGGIMDRLDSLLITAPLFFTVLTLSLGW